MDFLDPKKQRAHRNRLVIGYILISISVTLVTAIVALMVYGYGYNRQTGKVIQNGLVFVDSKPVSAKLSVNGQDKGQTAARLLLPEDKYTFLLTRDGYRDWTTSVFIPGGAIERLVYALLIPTKLVTKDVKVLNALPTMASQSPDHKNLIVLRTPSLDTLENYDLTTTSPVPKQINVPASLTTSSTKKNSWQVIEWSSDSRKFLVKHDFGPSSEYLIIDVFNPTRSVNISKLVSSEVVNDVQLYDAKVGQVYYRNKTNQLKLFGLNNKRVSLTLNNIIAYKSAGPDEIAYITPPKTSTSLATFGVYSTGLHTVRTLPSSKSYFVDIAQFDGDWYAAAGSPLDDKVYVYKDPVQQLATSSGNVLVPISVLKSHRTPNKLSFSTDNQYISLQAGSNFEVYDIQNDGLYNYDTKLKLASGEIASWLDKHHLYVSSSGTLRLWDFNGDNQQIIVSARSGMPMALTPDTQSLFSFGASSSSKSKTSLQLTSLLLP